VYTGSAEKREREREREERERERKRKERRTGGREGTRERSSKARIALLSAEGKNKYLIYHFLHFSVREFLPFLCSQEI
jgi:hypothetical protein